MSWAGVGDAYAASYAPLCAATAEPILDALGAAEGRSLLDVGAGVGDLAVRFREEGWEVTGCEPEASMREAATHRHPGLRLASAGLPELPFADGAFDVVTANFVLNHLADPRRGARELARVSSGRVVATIWSRSPSWFWAEVVERAGVAPAPAERLSQDKDFERTAEGFERMLADAGWAGIDAFESTWTWEVAPEALWESVRGGVAGAGAAYRGLGPADRERFRAGFEAVCAECGGNGALPLEHTAVIGVGRVG